MKKKNKPKPYKVRKQFDVDHITDFLISEVEDGNITWRDAIKDAALSAVAEGYFDDRFDSKDLMGTEYDIDYGIVEWELQEDYQLNN